MSIPPTSLRVQRVSAPVFTATCQTSVGEVGVSMSKVRRSEVQFGKPSAPTTPGGTGIGVRFEAPRFTT